LIDDEGIVYAEVDLSKCIAPKQMHDIVGHYNRFDVFQLTVNRHSRVAIDWSDPEPPRHTAATTDHSRIGAARVKRKAQSRGKRLRK